MLLYSERTENTSSLKPNLDASASNEEEDERVHRSAVKHGSE